MYPVYFLDNSFFKREKTVYQAWKNAPFWDKNSQKVMEFSYFDRFRCKNNEK